MLTSSLRRCVRLGAAASAGVLVAVVTVFVVASRRIPEDAPIARMYRTEAGLTALAKAIETYRDAHGAYPPAGIEGLRLATDYLSRDADYFPDG
ncbi:MAG TPA: hypothetical protein HPP83_11320, partial [Candidatus Hydrogenedentes bacterium]|nr:hypothetical protein [Candidatus Hydrogenedentota bacterium]